MEPAARSQFLRSARLEQKLREAEAEAEGARAQVRRVCAHVYARIRTHLRTQVRKAAAEVEAARAEAQRLQRRFAESEGIRKTDLACFE